MTDSLDDTSPDDIAADEFGADDLAMFALLRSLTPADSERDRLPPGLWEDIALGLVDDVHPASPATNPTKRAGPRRRWAIIATAAAAVAAFVTGAVIWVGSGPDGRTVVESAQLSSAGLEGAPSGLTGDAEVVESKGSRVIRVDIGSLRPTSGQFLEVWLIAGDISGMMSLGSARPDGTYELPPGLSLGDYPIVDVSTEPFDGNPAHSGDSLLRGVLGAAS